MARENVRIGEAAKILGVSIQTLRNWEKSGRLPARRSEGGQRFYAREDLERFSIDLKKLGWAWASSAQPPDLPDIYHCERHDRFTTRLEKMGQALLRCVPEETASLLTLVAGEIGDNSFAHNVGSWPDAAGVFYAYDTGKRLIVLADRGRGVRATLRQVRPDLASDTDALRVAFTEIVSGRNPEKRGNGLKVVRGIAESRAIGLLFRSGLGIARISKDGGMRIEMADGNVRGAYAVVTF